MERWRQVWREGAAPLLSTEGLLALREALERDDCRLLQRATTMPPPAAPEWPVEAACALGYPGAAEEGGFRNEWNPDGTIVLPLREGAATVGFVHEYFARVCWECDKRLAEVGGCRHFLQWYDETPRDEMRRELLPEVDLALQQRGTPCPP